jgi:preprotein translocase subunit SecY
MQQGLPNHFSLKRLCFLPMMLGQFDTEGSGKFLQLLENYTGFWYNLTFALLIIAFTYFYTAVTVNPTQMAEDMKRNGGFLPGVKPVEKKRSNSLTRSCQGLLFRAQSSWRSLLCCLHWQV